MFQVGDEVILVDKEKAKQYDVYEPVINAIDGKTCIVEYINGDDMRIEGTYARWYWPPDAFVLVRNAKQVKANKQKFTIEQVGRAISALRGWPYDETAKANTAELEEFLADFLIYREMKEKYKEIEEYFQNT